MIGFLGIYLIIASGASLAINAATRPNSLVLGRRTIGYPWGQAALALAWPILIFLRIGNEAMED